MNALILMEEAASGDSTEFGAVTRGMLRERAMELAMRSGRAAQEASKSDWEQAKQELMEDQPLS